MRRYMKWVFALGILGLIAWGLPRVMALPSGRIPGLEEPQRVMLRLTLVDAPGGGQAWLNGRIRAFEKANPQISVYLRVGQASELTAEGAILPDVVLFTPGALEDASALIPLTGAAGLREELLRAGRWRGDQLAMPLCWGGWVLAINSALEPGGRVTPAPTTLLGKPAATRNAQATPTPGYPLPAAGKADVALQSPGGAALFTLGAILSPEERPVLPENFAQETSAQVFEGFRAQKWATAMLTTGQAVALEGILPFRVMVADDVVTDQVFYGGLTASAGAEAAAFLAFLVSESSQEALYTQGLFPVRDDLALYASGMLGDVEAASRIGLTVPNAFGAREDTFGAAWRYWERTISRSEALLPLL